MSTTLADWTFETSAPTSAGPFAPEVGTGQATGSHASASAVYSSPVGNGSAHSFSSNFWAVGDYDQFKTSTAGFGSVGISFDQTSSGTGPKSFNLQYSTDGVTFTNFSGTTLASPYLAGTTSFSSGTAVTTDSFTADLSSVTALNNLSSVYFRLEDAVAPSGTAGTDRVDNVVISGAPIPVPSIASLSVSPTSVTVGAASTVTLTANNVSEINGGTASIANVNFYVGSVSAANLIGSGTQNGSNWSLSGVSTSGLPTGSTTYLAVATDSAAVTSASVSTSLIVNGVQQVTIDSATYAFNENVGNATIIVDRTGTITGAATVNYSTSDGSHFTGSNPEVDGGAVAGTDYQASSGTISFAANQSSATILVPVFNLKTFAGTRSFNVSLSNASPATIGTIGTTVVTITDNTVTAAQGVATPSGATTSSYEVEPTAGAGATNSFASLAYQSHNSFASASAPELEFGSGSTVFPGTYSAATVDSVKLSLYNTAVTGGFGGVPGSFDVYLLTNDSVAATTLTYAASGDTGAAVLGTPAEAGAVLVGTAAFTNNYVGYNDFTFDNLSSTVQTDLTNYFNQAGTPPIRFVIVPHSNSFMSVDWEGNFGTTEAPQLSLLVEQSTSIIENYKLGAATDTINKGSSDTITVTRTGTDLTDSATVPYTLTGPDVNGTHYTVTDPSGGANGTTTSTGTFHFAANQSTASVTISALSTAISPDTSFTLALGTPAPTGTNHAGLLGSPNTEVVTIHDPNTVNIAAGNAYGELATVLPTGPRTGANGTGEWQVEGAGTGAFASYAVADFNDNSVDPTDVFFPNSTSDTPPTPIAIINSLNLDTVSTGSNTFDAAGTANVYLVSDTSGSPQSHSPGLTFNTSADAIEGLGTQLGTKYLLGSITLNPSQSTSGYTYFPLTSASSTTMAMLISDLNTATKFRIVVTPDDNPATSEAMSWEGDPASASAPYVTVPQISINYTPQGVVTQPAWLALGSDAVYASSTKILTVTGPATIIADPGTDAPIIVGDGNSASDTGTPALTIAPTTTDTVFHLGGMNLANGATVAFNSGTSGLLATIPAGGVFSIDAASKLDLGKDLLSIQGNPSISAATLSTVAADLKAGSIKSSAAAADSTHLHTVGFALGSNVAAAVQTVNGTAIGANDVLIRYTYYGDANLDGQVDGSDYTKVDAGFSAHTTGWSNGDFDSNGKIDGSDYTLIDNAFNTQGTAVPAVRTATGVFSAIAIPSTSFAAPSSVSDLLTSDKKISLASIVDSLDNTTN